MEEMGVLSPIEEATEWCSGMVVVPKPNGKIRICVDLTRLNENVCRERHILPSVDETLAKLAGARIFSKLDATAGFWQVPLHKDSAPLTTLITSIGRYCFNRLPFRISSAPEHFQKRLTQMLDGLEGTLCHADDILVFGATPREHDNRVHQVLQRLQQRGLTLNDKCQFEKEALAVTWACERFQTYLLGLHFVMRTDHKPLISLLSSRPLDDVPPRIMRFILRLMRFSYSIVHVPGKNLITADALSRAPLLRTATEEDLALQNDVTALIPASMQQDILDKIPQGHQAMVKCMARAHEAVWWPGLTNQIREKVRQCQICAKETQNATEPLMTTPLPSRPWERLAADLFEWKKGQYFVVIDYYSRYIEVANLTSTSATAVIKKIKAIFSRHGVPDTLVTDNAPQFAAAELADFAKDYNFQHVTSGPRYPQSNGEAERAVKTVKSLLQKSEDPHKALMAYRATPLAHGVSPAQLLIGRNIQTPLPVCPSTLKPAWPDLRA
ncbi:uncharacterized protein K02A2.6-like [Clupea harengus]|uniref:Gypsy retrotransposon integrase-like protein 1 n=1 Tax=Clupea harengus TaxID=7950 RepID=A0A6P8FW55_CLUHA|nr:uncharacterized protein K02A2.6-like [Clupea harengus]